MLLNIYNLPGLWLPCVISSDIERYWHWSYSAVAILPAFSDLSVILVLLFVSDFGARKGYSRAGSKSEENRGSGTLVLSIEEFCCWPGVHCGCIVCTALVCAALTVVIMEARHGTTGVGSSVLFSFFSYCFCKIFRSCRQRLNCCRCRKGKRRWSVRLVPLYLHEYTYSPFTIRVHCKKTTACLHTSKKLAYLE